MTTLLSLLLWWSPAPCHAHEVPVDAVELQLALATDGLAALQQDAPLLDATQVAAHYEDALSAYLLGDHLAAAEAFYALERHIRDPDLHREAQWYQAASLIAADLPDLAHEALAPIVRDRDHPFHPDAVEAALELATRLDRPAEVLALTASLPEAERAAPHVRYVVGRSWLRLGEPARALEALGGVPSEHPDHARARYVLGAAHVAQGALDAARDAFLSAADDPIVGDHARLALARIAHHQGEGDTALRHYLSLDPMSPLLPDVLHELVWLHAGAGELAAARSTLDDLLVAVPEHPERAALLALRGHLAMRLGDLDDAERAYVDVDLRIGAVVDDLHQDRTAPLPAWAAARRDADPWVARAHHAAITAKEAARIAEEAAQVPLDADRLEQALRARHRRRLGQVALAAARGLWAAADAELAADDAPRGLRPLRAQHAALALELQTLAVAPDLDELSSLAVALEAHRHDVRRACADAHHDVATERLEALAASLRETLEAARATAGRPPTLSAAWRQAADREQTALDEAVAQVGPLRERADTLDHTITQRALDTLQHDLDTQVEGALAGLADVTWARLLGDDEALRDVIAQREAAVAALRATFDIARAR